MSSTQRVEVGKKATPKRTSAREQRRKRWDTLTDWARAKGAIILSPFAQFAGRLGIHPNTVTLFGMLLQVGIGVLFGFGYLKLGGLLLLIVSPVDALDGLLARTLGKQSRFGAFLDSTFDRLSDASLILGLAAYDMWQGDFLSVALLLIALVASMMVSYVRARAEALGFSCKGGLLTRMERIVLIGVLSAVGLHIPLVWALAVLSAFTMVQRIVCIYGVHLREDEKPDQSA
ncbi:MAG: CDP-alcohol phosphatidyltransferase family protein [Anaerolineae bacterium]